MKKYIYFGLTIIALVSVILFQQERIKVIDAERNIFRQNTQTLMDSVNRYKTIDSLNVVSVSQLVLKLSEFEKYRSSDMKQIESLKVDKKRLVQITNLQIETAQKFEGQFRDSIVWREIFKKEFQSADSTFFAGYFDTIKCIDISGKWFDIHGCVDKNSKFSGTIQNRDSLKYVEHIVPKKFLALLIKYI